MLRSHATAVAIAAGDLGQISDVYWVLEWNSLFVRDQWCSALQLSLYSVTSIAIFWNHLPVGADMLPVMTSEAAWRVEVANVVGMYPPVHLHVGEDRGLIDALKEFRQSQLGSRFPDWHTHRDTWSDRTHRCHLLFRGALRR